jgi:capsular polysaccharide transport system permease protein
MNEKIKSIGMLNALLRNRVLGSAALASLLAILYWGFLASDRYVSEAHVIVQKTELGIGQTMELSSLLGDLGASSGGDQLLLRDHLLSVDMLNKLDARLNLRGHFSNTDIDLISRMWSEGIEQEWFHRHYLSRVSVELDDRSGVLVIRAQGYDPDTAQAIASMLVEEGEAFMNAMAHRLAQEQVDFLERQVADMNARAMSARQAMLKFQNEKGLVSPQGTAENLAGIVNGLETRLAELQAHRGAMLGYLMPDSSDIVDLDLQIAAIGTQIEREKRRLAAPGGQALNETVEEFQRLEMKAVFAEEVYKTALVALEQGRIEAIRTLKKVSVLQSPTKPQYPLEPRRLYNSVVFVLAALLLAGIAQLIGAIVRDHKD